MNIYRVLRGGSWGYDAQYLRSAYRYNDSPGVRYGHIGFRLVRTKVSLEPLNILPSDRSARALAVAQEALKEIEKILKEKI